MSDHEIPGWVESLDDKVVECNRCGDEIIWAKTKRGKNCPMNAQPGPSGILESHFDYCGNKGQEKEDPAGDDSPW